MGEASEPNEDANIPHIILDQGGDSVIFESTNDIRSTKEIIEIK